jgi:serine/threonine protein kinase
MAVDRRRAPRDTDIDLPGDSSTDVRAASELPPDDLDSPTHRLIGPELAAIVRGAPTVPPRPPKLPIGTRPPPHKASRSTRAAQQRDSADDLVDTQKRRAPDPSLPKYLGGYRITALLAKGCMGTVYRGTHPTQRRSVAIKAIHGQLQKDPAVVGRFFAESVAIARVIHPNVVRFFDFGYDASGSAYLVMELLEGETLAQRLARERRLGIATAVDIACQIAQGLVAAHKSGVVHRDLKPDNIFLCIDPYEPNNLRVKLLDFGVAKVEGQGAMHTMQGDLLGTPAYMAPEQGRSASESDERSDVYSVGCILFEMLCGVVPFPGNVIETLLAHQTAQRPPARALNPAVSLELDAVLDRLLAREPGQRAQSANEVVSILSRFEETLGATALSPRAGTMIVGKARSASASTMVIAALVVLCVALGISALALSLM